MKLMSVTVLAATTMLFACASAPMPAPGMVAGKFVEFQCQGGRFSARVAEDGKTVRVRGLHGAAELDMKAQGVYEGEGYRLDTQGPNGVSLMHGGKANGTNCKAA
jgi:hypothetical protein